MRVEFGRVYRANDAQSSHKACKQLTGPITAKVAPGICALARSNFVAMAKPCACCEVSQVDSVSLFALGHGDDAISRGRNQVVALKPLVQRRKRALGDCDRQRSLNLPPRLALARWWPTTWHQT